MSNDLMHYDALTETAMRSVIRSALAQVAAEGLPGSHHFFITFDTNHAGVGMAERLRAAHPAAMTIVLQHQFRDLTVSETHFSVELSFNQIPEQLVIPYDAIISFFDPAVEFGLRFSHPDLGPDMQTEEDDTIMEWHKSPAAPATEADSEVGALNEADASADGINQGSDQNSDQSSDQNEDNIVSIDSFRKK